MGRMKKILSGQVEQLKKIGKQNWSIRGIEGEETA
jgi:hypothetical protein